MCIYKNILLIKTSLKKKNRWFLLHHVFLSDRCLSRALAVDIQCDEEYIWKYANGKFDKQSARVQGV